MIEKRLYKQVSSYSNETLDYTVPNNITLVFEAFGGDSSRDNDIKVEIWWDKTGAQEEILFSTHGDVAAQRTIKEVSGNGTRKVQIRLTNDTATAETIGAYWIGEEYG
jgi:hypothetical protein